MRLPRPELHWSAKILFVGFLSGAAPITLAGDTNRCTGSLLGASTLAPRTLQEEVDRAIRALSGLRLRLDLAQVGGSRMIALTALEAEFKKKEQELIAYLEEQKIMTRDELRESMKQEISQIQNQQQAEQRGSAQVREAEERRRREQDGQIKNSLIDGTRAIFHRIQPGSFKMGKVGEKVDVTLTQPFEMMATLTTQIIWKTVAELAYARFGDKYAINADPSRFKGGRRPVEQVSHDDVQTWLSALNELSQVGESALVDVIPDHKQGDVYRLPTEAEWEFVVRGRGQYNDKYHFGDQEDRFEEYAWFSGNSNLQTQPVARKKPLRIDGRNFHDMHGNVFEWVHDRYDNKLPGGTDPQGIDTGLDSMVIRGGSWSSDAFMHSSGFRFTEPSSSRRDDIGFRFVRTVRSFRTLLSF